MKENNHMKKLSSEDRLRSALAAKSVLRALDRSNSTLTYQQFAEVIGLKVENEPWHPSHRQQVGNVLKLLAAVEKSAVEKASSFQRIVNADTGEPGAGFYRDVKLVG
jgi:hypothetical protein